MSRLQGMGGDAVADPLRGYARFDGLSFETGSFLDSRRDRVMPILYEEQIFMCRQMKRTILEQRRMVGRGLSVLDVGAGSGVFAIYVDRLLNGWVADQATRNHVSPITALDVSFRATAMLRRNAVLNGVEAVGIVLASYPEECLQPSCADIIIINPPYHPVVERWENRLAIHAAAGEDGLKILREWKASIALQLRREGVLIGSIMSPIRGDGTIVALAEIQEALGSQSTVRYCRHLAAPDPDIGEFLSEVYRGYIDGDCKLREWVERTARSYSKITVVYFEARKNGGGGVVDDIELIERNAHVTWESRIRAHAWITAAAEGEKEGRAEPCQ